MDAPRLQHPDLHLPTLPYGDSLHNTSAEAAGAVLIMLTVTHTK